MKDIFVRDMVESLTRRLGLVESRVDRLFMKDRPNTLLEKLEKTPATTDVAEPSNSAAIRNLVDRVKEIEFRLAPKCEKCGQVLPFGYRGNSECQAQENKKAR